MENKYDEYAVKDAADTMMRAEEHKSDPKMMELVGKHLNKKKKHIHKITSIKELRALMLQKQQKPDSPADKAEDLADGGADEAMEKT